MIDHEDVLEFWFGKDSLDSADLSVLNKRWFQGGAEFDALIAARFANVPRLANSGVLDDWMREARSALALIVLLDQFPRNLYRNTPQAFVYDAKAQDVLAHCLRKNFHRELHAIEQAFLYLPYEHAEDLELQDRSVVLFTEMLEATTDQHNGYCRNCLDYAMAHRQIICQFGRFPHRNEILNRVPTPTEIEYLARGGHTF